MSEPAAQPADQETRQVGLPYDKEKDCYGCPSGRRLAYESTMRQERAGGEAVYRIYACEGCAGCPLSGECLSKQAKRRSVARDQHEGRREAMRARLTSPEGRAVYRRRAPLVEGTIGVMKAVLGMRQFLLRGIQNVKTEWFWACTAFNLRKLTCALRARTAAAGL